MSSQSVAKLFYGDTKNSCEYCEEEYIIHESTADDMAIYCCGECQLLDEEQDYEDLCESEEE